jgi:hypothetical protein
MNDATRPTVLRGQRIREAWSKVTMQQLLQNIREENKLNRAQLLKKAS